VGLVSTPARRPWMRGVPANSLVAYVGVDPVATAPPEGMSDWPFVAAVRATSALKSGARTLAETTIFQQLSEWARLGSNQRPLAYEATTLPASNRRFCLQISLIHAHP
jgi:hypothetical protein